MEDDSSRVVDTRNNLLRTLVIRGSRIRSNSTDTVLTIVDSGSRNEEDNETEEVSDATTPTAAKSDSEVLPSDPPSEASTITSLQRDETGEQEREEEQEQEQDWDEEEICHDCPGGHGKFSIEELILILNGIYKRSQILDDARLQTREHPAVQVDVSAIIGPLLPREPFVSISELRETFREAIEHILRSARASPYLADTGHFTAQQSTRLLELINSYAADMLHHCDRELFLRRHLALSEPEEGWIDVGDHFDYFRVLGHVLTADFGSGSER